MATYYVAMYEDLGMNDTVNDIRTFNYGFEFQSPKCVCRYMSSNMPSKQ